MGVATPPTGGQAQEKRSARPLTRDVSVGPPTGEEEQRSARELTSKEE